VNPKLHTMRQSIAYFETRVADPKLSDKARALAARALRQVRAGEALLYTRALESAERPEVLQ
jgi:hypothetical protein